MGESMMTASDNAGFERRNYPKPVIWRRKTGLYSQRERAHENRTHDVCEAKRRSIENRYRYIPW